MEEAEVRHLVNYYDTLEKDRNQVLTNDEWNSILLPCEDNTLREQVLAREAAPWKDIGRLPSDIEGQVTDILAKEVGLMRKLEALKGLLASVELGEGEAYSNAALFKLIDANTNGEFTMEELSAFLKSAGYDATEHECVQIIRRMDTDGSLTISLLEFEKFLTPLDPAPKEVDVTHYNPSSYVPERPYWSYSHRYPYYSRWWDYPYYSRWWDYPYYSRYWDSPYYYSRYSPYWRSPYYYDRYWDRPYYYDRYRYGYSSYDAYLDAKYGTYTAPVRYTYTPSYYEPVRTEVVYSSPVREKVVTYSSYSPVSTAYTYSSPVRTVYSVSPYRSYYYY